MNCKIFLPLALSATLMGCNALSALSSMTSSDAELIQASADALQTSSGQIELVSNSRKVNEETVEWKVNFAGSSYNCSYKVSGIVGYGTTCLADVIASKESTNNTSKTKSKLKPGEAFRCPEGYIDRMYATCDLIAHYDDSLFVVIDGERQYSLDAYQLEKLGLLDRQVCRQKEVALCYYKEECGTDSVEYYNEKLDSDLTYGGTGAPKLFRR